RHQGKTLRQTGKNIAGPSFGKDPRLLGVFLCVLVSWWLGGSILSWCLGVLTVDFSFCLEVPQALACVPSPSS
ncbi:MAG: hypothetical protein WBE78_04050, partial [Candidatus Binataceae bacterium]